jgi:hypothetical protein
MRYAEVKNGTCVNVIVADPAFATPMGLVELPDGYGVNDIYDGEWRHGTPRDLHALKATRIAETKTALATYLEEHPLQWADGKHYSITAEKQALLNNALAVYQIGVQAGMNPELTWNATGEECMAWEFTDLCALALGIAAYVKPLVAHQQALEVAIREAETAEELDAITVNYEMVNADQNGDN